MKVWLGVLGFVVGVAVGVAAGFALGDPAKRQAPHPQGKAAVPTACLDAIEAARDRLLLNPDVADTLSDYRDFGERLAEDASRLRVPDLRGTLGELNDLNERSSQILDRSVNSRFSESANDCEELAGKTPSPRQSGSEG